MRFICLLVFVFSLSSCSNELEIYGDDYVETPVIYGIIDLSNDTQAIRINKTFRNTESAHETLKFYDSLCFEQIMVQFTSYPSGKTVILNEVARPDKHSERRDIFVTATANLDNPFDSLRLSVTNLNNGTIFTATTLNIPAPNYFFPASNIINEGENSIGFTTKSGKLFNAVIRMYYTEYPKGNPGDSVLNSFDYMVPQPVNLNDPHASQSTVFKFRGIDLIATARVVIGATDKVRKFRGFSTYISAESNDMANYLYQQIPSIRIVQKNPFYSNISGAIGLFTSRGTAVRDKIQPGTTMTKLLKDKLNIDL